MGRQWKHGRWRKWRKRDGDLRGGGGDCWKFKAQPHAFQCFIYVFIYNFTRVFIHNYDLACAEKCTLKICCVCSAGKRRSASHERESNAPRTCLSSQRSAPSVQRGELNRHGWRDTFAAKAVARMHIDSQASATCLRSALICAVSCGKGTMYSHNLLDAGTIAPRIVFMQCSVIHCWELLALQKWVRTIAAREFHTSLRLHRRKGAYELAPAWPEWCLPGISQNPLRRIQVDT